MKAIIFDLDGTLLKFTRDYEDVLRETFIDTIGHSKKRWINNYNEEFFKNFNNMVKRPYYKSFSELDVDYPARVLVKELQKKEIDMCEVPKNCKKILDRIRENNQIGILTNGVIKWQEQKIKHYGLDEYFDDIVISYNTGHHKPNLNIYKYVEDKFKSDSYMMISDSYSDLRGCRTAGWEGFIYNGEDYDDIYKQYLKKNSDN